MPHFAENSLKIGWFVSEIQAVEGFEKQRKLFIFFGYILKLVFCVSRLILLDHITFDLNT